jgi:hypothetical protein
MHGEPSDARLGLRGLLRAIVLSPARAMRALAAEPGRRWVVPTVCWALLAVPAVFLSANATRAAAQAEMTAQLQRIDDPKLAAQQEQAAEFGLGIAVVVGAVAAAVGPFVVLGILAGLFHLVGTLLGGQQTFSQMVGAVAWARWPLVFQAAARLVYAAMGGFDARPDGLAGLAETTSFASAFLAEVSVWNLWSLLLLLIAVREVCRVSKGKALAAVAVFVVVKLVLGTAGVAVTRAMSSMFS